MPTKIEWCDEVWNPITGCDPISEGCKSCYAARMAKRLAGRCDYPKAPHEFDVTFHSQRLDLPKKWKTPRRIFVNSMGDLFHEDVDFQWIRDIFRVMVGFGEYAAPQHTYMILTKRPKRLLEWMHINYDDLTMHRFAEKYPNIWLGVTAENQVRADERIPILLSIPAAIHFVSVEPCLSKTDLTPWYKSETSAQLGWTISGPETGPKARLCKAEWIEDLWKQCKLADVPFFDKRKTNWIERSFPK